MTKKNQEERVSHFAIFIFNKNAFQNVFQLRNNIKKAKV
jgi:hypothetical protein